MFAWFSGFGWAQFRVLPVVVVGWLGLDFVFGWFGLGLICGLLGVSLGWFLLVGSPEVAGFVVSV